MAYSASEVASQASSRYLAQLASDQNPIADQLGKLLNL